MKPISLDSYKGREGVYIEAGKFCLVRVESAESDQDEMCAVVAISEPLVCYYRENPPRFSEQGRPFGDHWEISKRWEHFLADEDHWDGSIYLGFHIIFEPSVVERFRKEDLSWTENYF